MVVPPEQPAQAPAFPADFMAQLQAMIRSVVRAEMKPVYEELEHMKAVVDEDAAMQTKSLGESDSDEEDDGDEALARLAAAPASSAGVATAVVGAACKETEDATRKATRFTPY